MSSPTIHVLNKSDYTKHRLVTLPSTSSPTSTLPPSSLRLRTRIIGLTTNNFTYARMGHLVGWWDLFPPPASTPAPYNDPNLYGSIFAWGYAEILDSTVPDIAAGGSVYGTLPIGTLPVDVTVEQTGFKGQIFVKDEGRQHLWTVYNRLTLYPPLPELISEKGLEYVAWDSVSWGMFMTAYNMNHYAHALSEKHLIHPSGKGEWSLEDASLDDSAVIVLSASGKTAMAWAYCLRHERPSSHQPRTIIGVCSEASRATAEKSGFYDRVVLYADDKSTKEEVDASGVRKAILYDFGARPGMREVWDTSFKSHSNVPYTFISCGGEVKVLSPEETAQRMRSFGSVIQVNASHLREKGIKEGGDGYFQELEKSLGEFKKAGAFPGVKLKWGEGMENWASDWEKLCRDEMGADTGLVYRM